MLHSPTVAPQRLFFALRPPSVLARQIAAAAARLGGDLLAAERLHITMLILDDLPFVATPLAAALRAVGAAVEWPPVKVMLDRLVATGGSAALRPGAAPGLAALHDRLAGLARTAGIAERRAYRFSPHLTLGYRPPSPRSERVRPVGWLADELVLIHSYLGRTRHEVLGRWPLAGTDRQLALL